MTAPVTRLTFAEYAAIDAVNWSTAKYALVSAKHYQHACTTPSPDGDALRLGRATHTAVFEPDRLLHEYVIWDGGDRRGNAWAEFKAANAHKTILRPGEYEAACNIRDAVRAHPVAAQLLSEGTAECTLQWTDIHTGLPCKCRMDWLGSALVDLKTARDIERRVFGINAGRLQYHGQLAFYMSGLAAHGIDVPIKIIAVENTPPFDVAVYDFDDNCQYAGECLYQRALETVAECRATGLYPGRYPDEVPFALPSWEFPTPDEEDALYRGGDDE